MIISERRSVVPEVLLVLQHNAAEYGANVSPWSWGSTAHMPHWNDALLYLAEREGRRTAQATQLCGPVPTGRPSRPSWCDDPQHHHHSQCLARRWPCRLMTRHGRRPRYAVSWICKDWWALSPSEGCRSVAASSGFQRAVPAAPLTIFGQHAPHLEGLSIVQSWPSCRVVS